MALQALASTLDDEELSDLKDQFDAIDVDKNGSISLEEMRQVHFSPHFFSLQVENDGQFSINTLSLACTSCFYTNKWCSCRPLQKIYLGNLKIHVS